MAAEQLVSDAVDERTEQARKHVDEQEAGEEDVGPLVGPHADQNDVDDGGEEGQHVDEELDAVQSDGVAGLPGRGLARARGRPGGVEDLDVGDDDGQEDEGKQNHLKARCQHMSLW